MNSRHLHSAKKDKGFLRDVASVGFLVFRIRAWSRVAAAVFPSPPFGGRRPVGFGWLGSPISSLKVAFNF